MRPAAAERRGAFRLWIPQAARRSHRVRGLALRPQVFQRYDTTARRGSA